MLPTHATDRGIAALMVATTRFRRLFTSRTAYTLFMPALVKVYTESPQHPGIRPAIEYAVNRFYALHKESFLYQSLGIIGQMAMSPAIDEKAFAESVYALFFSLANTNPTIDAAGIHNVNKGQEREALIVDTAEEKPQTFLAAMRRADSASSQLTVLFPEEYEAERLRMDNFVRLFLTVIAHDLSIIRAQHYLRLLRLLAPHLYNCSASTRSVFLDGISALGGIMLKGAPKSKGSEPGGGKAEDAGGMESHSVDQTRIQSDVKAMRLDYLHLVLKLGQAGADLSLKVALQYLELVKLVLKDAALSVFATGISSTYNPEADSRAVSALLSDFVRMVLIREQSPSPKAVARFLQNLAPILHGYMGALDFTGIYDTVRQLSLMPVYAGDPAFSQVVVGQVCTAGLAACELAASENQYRLLLALPFRTAMVRLLAECVFVQGADVVAEIEKRAPTYPFLAGVVLPLVLELRTDSQLSADGLRAQERHRTVLTSAWLRLLFYAMGACQKSLLSDHGKGDGDRGLLSVSGSINGSIRSKSREKDVEDEAASGKTRRRGTGVTVRLRSQVAVLAVGLQIVKAIVVRAEHDISSSILGVWERLASFLKAMVSDGSSDFATRGKGMDGWNSARASEAPSPAFTPTASPRASAQFNPSSGGIRGSNMFVVSPSSPSFKFPTFHEGDFGGVVRVLRRPRVLDYMLWSTLEFLWAYRSPLRLQLRLLATEKIVALDSQLRSKGIPSSISRNSRFSHPPSPRSRRVSAMFLKSRGERSARSPAASPEVSPLLLPTSTSSQQQPTALSLDTLSPSPFLDVQRPMSLSANQRRPGYQMSPVTPIERPLGVPKIVHLGPASPSVLRNQPYPVSPSGLLANNAPGSRVSTLGAGLRAGLGGLGSGGSGRKKDKDGRRTGSGRAGQPVTGSDLIRTTKIKSVKLVEGTYRRIRGVQAVMGYDLLLPLPQNWSQRMQGEGVNNDDDSEVVLKSWTKSQALAAISQETKDLLEEFEYWMAVASREEPEDDSDEDEEGAEQAGLEVPASPSTQMVNDFGMLSPGGNGYRDSAPVTPVFRDSDDRLNLLHPHSFAPLTPRRHQSWQDEDGQSSYDNDDSSIHIEVDSTFVDSPNPSPIMTFQPQRRPSHIDG